MSKLVQVMIDGVRSEKYKIDNKGNVYNVKGNKLKAKGKYHNLYIDGKHRTFKTEKLLKDSFVEANPVLDTSNGGMVDFVDDMKRFKNTNLTNILYQHNESIQNFTKLDKLTDDLVLDIVEEVKKNPFFLPRIKLLKPLTRNYPFTSAHYAFIKAAHENYPRVHMSVSKTIDNSDIADAAIINTLLTTDKDIYILAGKDYSVSDLSFQIEGLHVDLVKYIDFGRIFVITGKEDYIKIPNDAVIFAINYSIGDLSNTLSNILLTHHNLYSLVYTVDQEFSFYDGVDVDVWEAIDMINNYASGECPSRESINIKFYLWDKYFENDELGYEKTSRYINNRFNKAAMHIDFKPVNNIEGLTSLNGLIGFHCFNNRDVDYMDKFSANFKRLAYENHVYELIKDKPSFINALNYFQSSIFMNHFDYTKLSIDTMDINKYPEELKRAMFVYFHNSVLSNPACVGFPEMFALLVFGVDEDGLDKFIYGHTTVVDDYRLKIIHDILETGKYNTYGRVMSSKKTYRELLKFIYG